MLAQIAKETTIHGVHDAWRANRIGRAFFITIFACCIAVMVLQLKGLFYGYITEAVGETVTSTTKFDTIELPSIYYCNRNWLPKAEPLWHYKPVVNNDSTLNYSYDQVYEECVHKAGYNKSIRQLLHPWTDNTIEKLQLIFLANEPKQYCKHFLQYWKSLIKQVIVNAITQPLDNRIYDYYSQRQRRPELSVMTRKFAASILSDPIQRLLKTELRQGLQAFVEHTAMNITIKSEGDYKGCATCAVRRHESSSSIMSQVRDMKESQNFKFDNYVFYYFHAKFNVDPLGLESLTKPFNHTLHPSAVSISLDGVCWEFAQGPQYLATALAVGRTQRHVVLHLAGLVHHLQTLGHISTTDILLSSRYGEQCIARSVSMAIKYANVVGDGYYTDVAISKQKEPSLYFHQKIRLDSRKQLVSVKYWKKSNAQLNTKSQPCRPAPWTELDQAHCNQQLPRSPHDKSSCDTYLPASQIYPETPVTNRTCIYDHTGIFRDIFSAMNDLGIEKEVQGYGTISWNYRQSPNIARQLSAFGPARVRYDNHSHVTSRLTKANPDCPKPCSRTIFSYQTSYPAPNRDDVRMCHIALAYWLTPQTIAIHDWKVLWFLRAKKAIDNDFGWETPYCSVIDYEQTEAHGQVSEQYLLHGLPALAASFGGTLSLWIGASVISVVQLIYLCCLRKYFRTLPRKVAVWRRKRFGPNTRSIAPDTRCRNMKVSRA